LDTMHPMRYDPSKDDTALLILLKSGREWLSSQSANNDVRELDACHRSLLYQIGSAVVTNEEEELQGKTFVPTRDVSNIILIFEHLVIYLDRTGWNGMNQQKEQILKISDSVGMFDTMLITDASEDEILDEVVKRVIETNIIPGLIMAITLEKPSTPNGRTTISDFIAVRSINKNAEKKLHLRSPNEISKEANQMLRLSRHAAASHLNRTKLRMTNMSLGDEKFREYTNTSIRNVQTSQFTHTCCSTIRLGREITAKNPFQVFKAHDPLTGEIVVENVSIEKSIWSRAIPFTIELLSDPFRTFFQCPNLLDKFLHTSNKVTLAGKNTSVRVVNSTLGITNDMAVREIMPTFTESNEIMQSNVKLIWYTLRGAMAYLSSGATRGKEVGRLHSFEHWKMHFNMLRFQTYHLKGENHGQRTNELVSRLLPPSISRYAILAFTVLFPAIEEHDVLTLPSEDEAEQAAAESFARIMHLEKFQSIETSLVL
jgi:hypothetical protein